MADAYLTLDLHAVQYADFSESFFFLSAGVPIAWNSGGATAATLSAWDCGAPVLSLSLTPTASGSLAFGFAGVTATLVPGSETVTFSRAISAEQGRILTFGAQPGAPYSLAAPILNTTTGTLATPYVGASSGASVVDDGSIIVAIANAVTASFPTGYPVPYSLRVTMGGLVIPVMDGNIVNKYAPQ